MRENREMGGEGKKKNVVTSIRRFDRMETRVNSINEICYRGKWSNVEIEGTNSANASRVVGKHARIGIRGLQGKI